jgi:murein DD-endopeptidase MepM/ murein hydrolase activator NlpD
MPGEAKGLRVALLLAAIGTALGSLLVGVAGGSVRLPQTKAPTLVDARAKHRYNEHRPPHGKPHDYRGPSLSIGGGFNLGAPWQMDKTLAVGGACGSYFHQGAHRDYGGRWDDDRYAIDIGLCNGAALGTPVTAATDGVVALAGRNPEYGNTVVVELSKNGLATRYAHLGTLTVKRGDRVRGGQQIGTLGHSAAGPATNAHLHFVVYGSRRLHKGVPPVALDGFALCDGCVLTSHNAESSTGAPSLFASLLAVTPGEALIMRPGESASFSFRILFSRAFDPYHFVLRPTAAATGLQFTGATGDLTGAPDPGNGDVGTFGGGIDVPAGTPTGLYALEWDVVDSTSGQLGHLTPRIQLLVRETTPAPGRSLAMVGGRGYVLDGWGSLHAVGTADPIRNDMNDGRYWPSWDIARSLALRSDARSGYVLDGYGGIHPFGGAPAVKATAYWSGWDIARSIGLRPDGQSGYVLDGYGGLHSFGDAPPASGGPYWQGWDIARAVAVRANGTSGYVLDGYGAVHPFGGAPAASGGPYWQGWDIARNVALRPDGQSGYVLDGYGGVHGFGGAPPVKVSRYDSGGDNARGIALTSSGNGGWVQFTDGGVAPFGDAPPVVTSWGSG